MLKNESLGGVFARGFRSQVFVADEFPSLGSVLRLFDERPVQTLAHHGAMAHVASVLWVFF